MNTDAQLTEVIDTDRYPIHEPGMAAYDDLVFRCRESLAEDGCCTLPGLLRPDALKRITREAERLAPLAHRHRTSHNPYSCDPRPELGEGHPVNRFQQRMCVWPVSRLTRGGNRSPPVVVGGPFDQRRRQSTDQAFTAARYMGRSWMDCLQIQNLRQTIPSTQSH